jgi:hypothetical protein
VKGIDPAALAALGVVLAPLTAKATSFVKAMSAKAWRDAVTQVLAWGLGVGAVWLAAAANDFTGKWVLVEGGPDLAHTSVAALVLIGTAVGSAGSLLVDFRKAIDGSDSAKEPPLGG